MAGYKVWGATDLLTSADVNGFLMQQAIPVFATVTARDAAITSPVQGQMCTTQDFDELYLYNGTSWQGAVPRTKIKPADTSPAINANTTFQDDPDLQFALEASSTYTMSFDWQYIGGTVGDIKFTFSYSGTMSAAQVGIHFMPTSASTAGNQIQSLDSFGTPLSQTISVGCIANNTLGTFGYGYWKTTTGGTLKLRLAQNASEAVDTLLRAGSYISLLKVA